MNRLFLLVVLVGLSLLCAGAFCPDADAIWMDDCGPNWQSDTQYWINRDVANRMDSYRAGADYGWNLGVWCGFAVGIGLTCCAFVAFGGARRPRIR